MYDQKVKQMACGERVDDVFSEQMAMVVSQEAVELYMDPARCPEAMMQYNGSFLVHGRKGYVMYRERRVASAKVCQRVRYRWITRQWNASMQRRGESGRNLLP